MFIFVLPNTHSCTENMKFIERISIGGLLRVEQLGAIVWVRETKIKYLLHFMFMTTRKLKNEVSLVCNIMTSIF